MNNLNYDLIKLQLYQLENDFNAKMDELKKGMNIEEKKIPEKLNLGNATVNEQQIEFKINEILDYLKSKGE